MDKMVTGVIHSAKNSHIRKWVFAVAGSIALNLTLFGLMPGLIQKIPSTPDRLEELRHVNVIRIKRDETPLHKKEPSKIVKPKPVKKIQQARPARVVQKKINIKPQLKFELNPKLPAVPMDLVMPQFEQFSMDVPILKGVYGLAELDTALMPLVKIPPLYPSRARRRGIEGFVSVSFLVTHQGRVQDIEVVEAEPENMFNQSVINCVSHWKFKPPTVEGIPVATRAGTTIYFNLEE